MVISTWVFGRLFLANELSKPVSSRKTIDYLLPILKKFWISKEIWNFGKLVSLSKLDSFSVFRDFSDEINGNISECKF